jgi:hypothetical protein
MQRHPRFQWLVVAALLTLAGCAPEDQKQFESGAQAALDKTEKGFAAAWKGATDQARKLDLNSSKEALDKAVAELKAKEVVASSYTQQQAAALRDQIDRLNLAEKVQDLQKEADSRLKDLDDLRKRTAQGIESSQKIRDQVEQDYLKANAALEGAKRDYDNATRKAQAAWDAVAGP